MSCLRSQRTARASVTRRGGTTREDRTMNWKSWVPLVLAIGLGLFSAKLIRDVVAKRSAQQPSDANLKQIVVTKFPIGPGQELRAEDLTTGGVAATAVPEGSFL